MSGDLDLIRGLYVAWAAGDRETAMAGIDPAIEWTEPSDSPEHATHRGFEGVERSMARWVEPYDEYGFEVERMRDLGGGRVLVSLRQHGRPRGASVRLEETIFHLWTIRAGYAVRTQMFRTEADALEAASRPARHA